MKTEPLPATEGPSYTLCHD